MRPLLRKTSSNSDGCQVAIVGAGPAGVAAAGVLLDMDIQPVIWVDPSFTGGRLAHYHEVPSNTQAKLFTQFGLGCTSFGGVEDPAVAPITALDQDKGCDLRFASEMTKELAARLRRIGGDAGVLQDVRGVVTRLEHIHDRWKVTVDGSPSSMDGNGAFSGEVGGCCGKETPWPCTFEAEMVFLATGSHPRLLPTAPDISCTASSTEGVHPEVVPLETALSPSALRAVISPQDNVAVVGSSHSAVLVLKNLAELPIRSRPVSILNLYRSPLVYAQYREDEHGSWILHDNTGLKGVAAKWAKQFLEDGSKARVPGLERFCLAGDADAEKKVYERALKAATKIIYAIGYARNRLPEIIYDGARLSDASITHNHKTGQLQVSSCTSLSSTPIRGLFGWGIAFPELRIDPWGNREASVGLFKFMRYMRVAVPSAVKGLV